MDLFDTVMAVLMFLMVLTIIGVLIYIAVTPNKSY